LTLSNYEPGEQVLGHLHQYTQQLNEWAKRRLGPGGRISERYELYLREVVWGEYERIDRYETDKSKRAEPEEETEAEARVNPATTGDFDTVAPIELDGTEPAELDADDEYTIWSELMSRHQELGLLRGTNELAAWEQVELDYLDSMGLESMAFDLRDPDTLSIYEEMNRELEEFDIEGDPPKLV
jgi:hypothetical protein